MQPVFEAVAHRNPFPRDHFSEAQWNQMVVKTLFIGSRLAPIQGLDERRNADLAIHAHRLRARALGGRPLRSRLSCGAASVRSRATPMSSILPSPATGSETEREGGSSRSFRMSAPEARTALETVPHLAAAIREPQPDLERHR